MKKQFLVLFAFISVLALSQVPQRFNKVIVTGDIASPKFIKTGSNADSVLLGNGSARSVNSLKTDTVSLSNRINAKATGNGTANGTNTGDETLTSIKTKLGAATSVSDGYLTSNMFNVFNNSEPSFTKNSAFNKNFGTTTGTVLEGRTFGTAANSAVGDFQPTITSLTTNYIPKWGGSSFVNSLISDDGTNIANPNVFKTGGLRVNGSVKVADGDGLEIWYNASNLTSYISTYGRGVDNVNHPLQFGASSYFFSDAGNVYILSTTPSTLPTNGALVVNGGIGVGGNVTASGFKTPTGTSSQFLKANGSVDATNYQPAITLTTNGTSGAATLTGTTLNIPNYTIAPSSGNYAQSITLLSGLASSASTVAMYTKNGNNYHVGLSGVLTTNAAGTCSFRIQLPSSVTGSNAVVIPHIFGLSGSYVAHSYASSFGSTNVVDISFISTSVSGSSFNYNVMIDYY